MWLKFVRHVKPFSIQIDLINNTKKMTTIVYSCSKQRFLNKIKSVSPSNGNLAPIKRMWMWSVLNQVNLLLFITVYFLNIKRGMHTPPWFVVYATVEDWMITTFSMPASRKVVNVIMIFAVSVLTSRVSLPFWKKEVLYLRRYTHVSWGLMDSSLRQRTTSSAT